jgi:hypothetical protein
MVIVGPQQAGPVDVALAMLVAYDVFAIASGRSGSHPSSGSFSRCTLKRYILKRTC